MPSRSGASMNTHFDERLDGGQPGRDQSEVLVDLPETLEQVETLLKRCRALGVPVVTRGAGTGLSGGAMPLEHGVLLVLSRFNRILEIDPDARTARVQPGVRNLAISEAAAPYGLYYAPDPSSQIACSIRSEERRVGKEWRPRWWPE